MTALCAVLQVGRSSYYAWLKRLPSRRQQEDEELTQQLTAYFDAAHGLYGARRLQQEYLRDGRGISRKRVRRLMKTTGLEVRAAKPWVPRTTDSSRTTRSAPNHLDRDFSAERANQKWVGDITYVKTADGWLYLAVVIDLSSRMVVGHAMSRWIDTALVSTALRMALLRRRPEPGLLFHSDRGSQYASEEYRRLMASVGIIPSMSRRGNCWDNAVSESFFATLKRELIPSTGYQSYREAEQAIFAYIEIFYNRRRYHSALNYCSPLEVEQQSTTHSPLL